MYNHPLWHKVVAFVGVWQGVVLPSIPQLAEFLKLTSAGLGTIIGLLTLITTIKDLKRKKDNHE